MSGVDLHNTKIDATTGTELTAPSEAVYDARWVKTTGGTISDKVTITRTGTTALDINQTSAGDVFITRNSGAQRFTVNQAGGTDVIGSAATNLQLKASTSVQITPNTNGTTTLQVTKADGTTSVLDVDTTSARVGIGTASPDATLKVAGLATVSSGFDGVGDSYTSRGVTGGGLELGWDATNNYGNIAAITEGTAWRRLHFRAMEHVFQAGSGPIAGAMLLSSAGNLGIGLGIAGANSRLQVAGAIATAFSANTAAYTLTVSDSTVTADGTSGAFQITLPTAAGVTGRQYTIKRINAGANNITVSTTSSQTVDGVMTKTLGAQWSAITVQSDGANWVIINQMGTVT